MALRPTIHRAEVEISDIDRGHYATHTLTLARHPSETDERLMVRLLAFALDASEQLAFGAGLSESDEPDLWEKDLTGAIQHWIDVGQPDARLIRKASRRAERVKILAYGKGLEPWWNRTRGELSGLINVTVLGLTAEESATLGTLSERNMSLHVLVQDGHVTVSSAAAVVELTPIQRFP
jgi:uncharacterized protein YaeQ